MYRSFRFTFSALTLGILFASGAAQADDSASMAQLKQQVNTLQQQLNAMQTQLQQMTSAQSANALPMLPAQNSSAGASRLGIFGYGEINYTRPVHQTQLTQADLARAVFGFSYAFDERTHFNSEFEVEHAVASADDKGEMEVEQFYIDHQMTNWASVRGGLFLMPAGLLNTDHEPTHYYGVTRNFVETLIIPSTWREGGVAVHGDTESGFLWDLGLTTGFTLAGYDNQPAAPQYQTANDIAEAAPLQQMHQELSGANAQHLSQYVSLNYKGIPGTLFGASIFTGNLAMPEVPANLPDQRLTLWEVHARYNPGRLDLSALYAQGNLSHTGTYNQLNPNSTSPEPNQFDGWYGQAAYTVWRHNTYQLTPFVRYEHYDMGADYDGLGVFPSTPTAPVPGYGAWPEPRDQVLTYGVNFNLSPQVVIKTDYQRFSNNRNLSRFELGLGLTF